MKNLFIFTLCCGSFCSGVVVCKYVFVPMVKPKPVAVIEQSRGSLVVNEAYLVTKIRVLKGHIFDIMLSDSNARYRIVLDGISGTVPESEKIVIQMLHEAQNFWFYPVRLDSQGDWIGRLVIDDTDLGEWLYIHNLAYRR